MKNRFLSCRDYAKLYNRAKRTLDCELSKPSEEWDEGLIEELEETMLYCAERKKVLFSEEKSSKSFLPSIRLRRALLVVVAVLVTLALSATIAQAAGFRVWSALIHWDLNYLRVDYNGNPTDTPSDESINTGKAPIEESDAVTINFDTYNALLAYMDNRILLPSRVDGLEFVSASLTEDEELIHIRSNYLLNDESVTIYVTVNKSANQDNASFGSEGFSDFADVYKKDFYGTECVLGAKEESIYCSFIYNDSVYLIICNAGEENTFLIIEAVLKGGSL